MIGTRGRQRDGDGRRGEPSETRKKEETKQKQNGKTDNCNATRSAKLLANKKQRYRVSMY